MNEAKRIEPAELKQHMEQGDVIVLDMRRDYDKSDSRILGAQRGDPDRYQDAVNGLPKEKLVVTYCT